MLISECQRLVAFTLKLYRRIGHSMNIRSLLYSRRGNDTAMLMVNEVIHRRVSTLAAATDLTI